LPGHDNDVLSLARRNPRTDAPGESTVVQVRISALPQAGVRDFRLVAGYSGTPLFRKLGVKEGATLALLDAPEGVITGLPTSVVVKQAPRGKADVVVAFFTTRSALQRRLGMLGKMIFPSGGLWIAWPKRASGVASDLTDEVVRELALPLGLVDNKVCAIDDTWSGLRIVWRRELRGP
jgi:hypothetical protein